MPCAVLLGAVRQAITVYGNIGAFQTSPGPVWAVRLGTGNRAYVNGLTASHREQYHLNYRPRMSFRFIKNAAPVTSIAGKSRLIWERLDNEPVAYYLRFCKYRDWPSEHDGDKRGLLKTAGSKGSAIALASRLCSQFNWVSRAAAYDDYMEGRLRKRLEESRLRMKERQVKLGISMQDMAQTSLQTGVIQPESVSDIVKLAESGTRIERLAQGESTENVAQGISVVWGSAPPPWAPQHLLDSAAGAQKKGAAVATDDDTIDAEFEEVAE